jgi:hypothetical protein
MRNTSCLIRKLIAGCLVILVTAPFAQAAPASYQQTMPNQSSPSPPPIQGQAQDSDPESTGRAASATSAQNPLPAAPNTDASQSTNQNGQTGLSQPVADQQQNGVTQPVGTAAAPYEETTGVTASRPAGAVIAPAKQRRARSFIIKVGVVVGACVAIGTVAALSHASPSQPH